MAYRLVEVTRPGLRTGLSQEDGRAEWPFHVCGADDNTPPTVNGLREAAAFFLGGASNLEPKVVAPGTAGAGKVVRVLPPIHPFLPELSATGIKSIEGVGTQREGQSVEVVGLKSTVDKFAHYDRYEYVVEYGKRPYFLLPNEKVELKSDLMYHKPGSTSTTIHYAEEWRRFTQVTRKPLDDTVNATLGGGQMKYYTQSGNDPHNKNYNGQAFMYMQNQMVEVMWYQVPYRYFLDFKFEGGEFRSYLNRFVNCVNQHDWFGFKAGSLLYLGAEPQSYIPAGVKVQQFLNVLNVGLDQSLLMNVKLRFLYTSREGTDLPNDAHALRTDKSNVIAGHNLQPWFFKRAFAYVAGPGATDAQKMATFQSFPFQLLMTDPLLLQSGGPI